MVRIYLGANEKVGPVPQGAEGEERVVEALRELLRTIHFDRGRIIRQTDPHAGRPDRLNRAEQIIDVDLHGRPPSRPKDEYRQQRPQERQNAANRRHATFVRSVAVPAFSPEDRRIICVPGKLVTRNRTR
jgi:hypothetical protein